MSPVNDDDRSRSYWRSLDELADTPEFRELVRARVPRPTSGIGCRRRPAAQFLKVMGASLALAGLAGCRWPKEEIVPFANRPDGRDARACRSSFATAMELGGVALGLLVTSYDGRPIKIEGNPEHPDSLGAPPPLAQATVLGAVRPRPQPAAWSSARAARTSSRAGTTSPRSPAHFAGLRQRRRGLARARRGIVVADAWRGCGSASLDGVPEARLVRVRAGLARQRARGRAAGVRAAAAGRPRLDRARVIVVLRRRPAARASGGRAQARASSPRRAIRDRPGGMSRLYVVESALSPDRGAWPITGWRCAAGQVPALLAALAAEGARRELGHAGRRRLARERRH